MERPPPCRCSTKTSTRSRSHTYVGHGLDGLLEGNDMEAAAAQYPNRTAPPEVQDIIRRKLATEDGAAYMLTRPPPRGRPSSSGPPSPSRGSKPLWLTEFNLSDHVGAVRNTWSHALFIAAMMERVPRRRAGRAGALPQPLRRPTSSRRSLARRACRRRPTPRPPATCRTSASRPPASPWRCSAEPSARQTRPSRSTSRAAQPSWSTAWHTPACSAGASRQPETISRSKRVRRARC